jgi:hypothetical protein
VQSKRGERGVFGFVGDSHLVIFMLQSLMVERTSGRGIRVLMVLALTSW